MAFSDITTTLPVVAHLYDHTGATFKQSFKVLNTLDLSLAINGQGASGITIELEAPLSGGNAAPAKGDILTLTEDGSSSTAIVFKGIVEDFPEQRGSTTAHEILVNPVGVQLGDVPFGNNYTTATDIALMVRDMVSACANLTWDTTSIPLTGVTAIFNFSGQGYTALSAMDEARKMAGINYYYWPDTTGKVNFLAASTATATHSIYTAKDTSARSYVAPVAKRKNIVKGYGAMVGTAAISATYDNSAGSPLGKRALTPDLSYNTLTDLTTLQAIVNTVGALLDREHVTVTLDINGYANRILPGDTLRYYEENVNERPESSAGAGAWSNTYVVLSARQIGPRQSVVVSDLPATVDDLKYLIDRMIARTSQATTFAITPTSIGSIGPGMFASTTPTTPLAPTLATALDQNAQTNNAHVAVTWIGNPTGDAVASYVVRYRQGTGPYSYQYTNGSVTTQTIRGLLPGTSYGFSVAAINTIGNGSAYSAETTITTASDSTAPAVPTGLAAYATPRGALVSWTANTEADLQGYELQVSIAGAAYIDVLAGPTLTTSLAYVAPSGTAQGSSLTFKVRSVDQSNNVSAFSAASTAVNTDGMTFDELMAGNLHVFGTLTTGGLQTAASGARLVLDGTSLRIYDGTATNYGAPSGAGVTVELKKDGTGFFSGTVSASTVVASKIQGTAGGGAAPLIFAEAFEQIGNVTGAASVLWHSLGTETGTDNSIAYWTTVTGTAPTYASHVMTIPAATIVKGGHPDWTWSANDPFQQFRVQWVTGATISVYITFVDASNWIRWRANGTSMFFEKSVAGTITTLNTISRTLTTGNWYWVCPQSNGNGSVNFGDWEVWVYNDSAGAIGSLLQTIGGVVPDTSISTGCIALGTTGASMAVGGAFANVVQVKGYLPSPQLGGTPWNTLVSAGEPAFAWSAARSYNGTRSMSIYNAAAAGNGYIYWNSTLPAATYDLSFHGYGTGTPTFFTVSLGGSFNTGAGSATSTWNRNAATGTPAANAQLGLTAEGAGLYYFDMLAVNPTGNNAGTARMWADFSAPSAGISPLIAADDGDFRRLEFGNLAAYTDQRGIVSPAGYGYRARDTSGNLVFDTNGLVGVGMMTEIGVAPSIASQTVAGSSSEVDVPGSKASYTLSRVSTVLVLATLSCGFAGSATVGIAVSLYDESNNQQGPLIWVTGTTGPIYQTATVWTVLTNQSAGTHSVRFGLVPDSTGHTLSINSGTIGVFRIGT